MAGDTETVVVVRPPPRDRFGDPQPGAVVEFEILGCRFAPGQSQERGPAANTVDTDGTVYAPPGEPATLVEPTDRIRVRGDLYSVVGKPQDWGTAGVVIELRLVEG